MWRIYDCIVTEHDYRLVLVAAAICLFGSATTFVISDRAQEAGQRMRWLLPAAVCSGTTVWSTHFVAMLAFQQDIPVSYALYPTAASLLAGILGSAVGFGLALLRSRTRPALEQPAIRGNRLIADRLLTINTLARLAAPVRAHNALGGGVAMGVGVVVLHYLGMSAVRLPGRIVADADLLALATAFSLAFGAASFWFAFGPRARNQWAGLACFVLMVVTLHFTAMGAVRIEPGPWLVDSVPQVSRETLAILVTVTTAALLAVGLAGALFDRRRSIALVAEAERFRVLSDSALEGLILHRNGTLLDSNAAARRLLGLGDAPESQSIYPWFGGAPRAQVEQWLAQPSEAPVEVQLTGRTGHGFTAEICGASLTLRDGSSGRVLAIRDVTARKRMEAQLQHQTLHDPLTDLPNRRLFLELAETVKAQAERRGEHFAILMLGVDNFKTINDVHGHGGGDELLMELARRIQRNLRGSDVVARGGGDEFTIIATGKLQPHESRVLAERLLETIAKPVVLQSGEVAVSASIGVAIYPSDGRSVDEVLRNAGTAMSGAKTDGKGMFKFFEPRMNRSLEARHTIEARLRRAIAEEALTVAYQPVVDCRTRRTIGFEALVRWTDATLGRVSPTRFIPIAEETGLIVPLGEYVLRTACRDATRWHGRLRVGVNLSATQFRRPGLADTVAKILAETGLPGDRLDLEITESIVIDNRAQVLETLHALKALGIRVSMDDFGTGYSSLGYLQSFPFDKIKIDRAFVSGLEARPQSASIIRAVVAMGHSLGMKVVAEGVETDAQADKLHELACDELQGFLIAKPMPAHEVDAFVADSLQVAEAS